ncbi:MAG: ribbon-helix-helix domain-containing protein [Candidatus Desulfacyla sp.]|jgi:Arc/MetJ-type ribon-helix-helix transcriptional regulator
MKTVAVKLPDSLLAEIENAAKEKGENRSALIRMAIEEFLAVKGKLRKGSCLDLARDLAGTVKGKADLSTNEKHMDGYGQ